MADDYIRRQEMLDAVEKLNIIPSVYGTGKPTPTEDFRVQFLGTVLHVPSADVVSVNMEKLIAVLRDYFSIGDSYTYELKRVKSAFDIGTMSLDDFKEWEEEDISCLCDYILRELRRGNNGG